MKRKDFILILNYTEKNVRLGKKNYTIVIPDDIEELHNRNLVLDGDRKALNAILMSLLMLMEKKDIIVYFPLWHNEIPKYYNDGFSCFLHDGNPRKNDFDVVFLPHYMQFSVHDWKEIRQSIKKLKGEKHKFRADSELKKRELEPQLEHYSHTKAHFGDKDAFEHYCQFDTLFFVGGKYSFAQLFCDLSEMLQKPLEKNFSQSVIRDYVCFPYAEGNARENHDDVPEIRFYTKELEEENQKAWEMYFKMNL